MGAIHYRQGDTAAATGDFQQAVALDPSGPLGRMAQENLDIITSVSQENGEDNLPQRFLLQGNYPNPFNPETSISFALPRESSATLQVYNLLGQTIRTMTTGELEAGWHHLAWDGCDGQGHQVESGVYLYRLEAGEHRASGKMTLVR